MFRLHCPTIITKKKRKRSIGETMTPKVEQMKTGTCGCGRSPTGNCIGWHGLSEDAFQARLAEFTAQQESANSTVKDSQQGG
jgi:hypothetical protein